MEWKVLITAWVVLFTLFISLHYFGSFWIWFFKLKKKRRELPKQSQETPSERVLSRGL